MDMKLIGRFLSELRKSHGMTQEQLGERLGVTGKTISRWETGNYLPPVDMLLELSRMYDLSINELLMGKKLTAEEDHEAAEKNLCAALESAFSAKERLEYFKKKWKREHIAEIVVITMLCFAILAVGWYLKRLYIPLIVAVISPVCCIVRYNRMMAYAERHAFTGNKTVE